MNNLTSGYVIKPRLSFSNRFDKALYGLFVDEANFATTDYCERGQQRYVVKDLAKEMKVTANIITNSIKRLESQDLIQKETLKQNRGILITVKNYDEYQKLTTYQKPKESQTEAPQVPVKSEENAHDFYQQQIGILAPMIAENINQWIDDFDGNQEVIIAAMKVAVEHNARNWKYIEAILKDWHGKNARTMDDIRALELEKRRKKRNGQSKGKVQHYGRSAQRSTQESERKQSDFHKPVEHNIDDSINELL
ncbi:DnaD domain protein [Priestia filamentosa]|uniref:DnaD domain protein n=1 Tax=Priestia filamentosa TaxID=1402861 RepID=UPI0006196361|nr:DnaD domain protein [Priestia filamentosa]